MEQNSERSSIIYGLLYIGGLISLKFLLSAPKIGFLSTISFFISVLILFLLYKFAVQNREQNHGGVISFGKAFAFMFKVYFFCSIISSVIMLIYSGFINKDYFVSMMNDVLKMYENMNIELDDKTYGLIEVFYRPVPMFFMNILSGAITAAFWAVIFAGFVKKEKSIFE